jgi:DNA repair protein RecO (recombination protein O)
LLVRFGGRGEVKTLRSAEAVSLALPLSGITLYSGLYVNELIPACLSMKRASPNSFRLSALYSGAGWRKRLAGTALRRFELALLGHRLWRGFSPLRRERRAVDDTMTYRYREEKGFIASVVIDNNTFTGHHLKALASREFPDVDTLRAAKRFTRIALKPYLGGKPLKSGNCFAIMPARKARADNE